MSLVPQIRVRSCYLGRILPFLARVVRVVRGGLWTPKCKCLQYRCQEEADDREHWFEVPAGENKMSVEVSGGANDWITVSKLILMLPTLVAPTGTIEKNPYFQRPSNATRSLRTNR